MAGSASFCVNILAAYFILRLRDGPRWPLIGWAAALAVLSYVFPVFLDGLVSMSPVRVVLGKGLSEDVLSTWASEARQAGQALAI